MGPVSSFFIKCKENNECFRKLNPELQTLEEYTCMAMTEEESLN